MISGVIAGSRDFIASLIDINSGSVMLTGPVMDAKIAHELYLRLDHLPIRMEAHSKAAQFLAERMEAHDVPVFYPGLKSHPQHQLMQDHMNEGFGFGGMLTVDCKTSKRAMELATELQNQKFGLYAVSLGFSRTLMSCPSVSTSSEIPEKEQREMNLSPGLLRLSIGFTGDLETQWERFWSGYQRVSKAKP
jgi:methionine-gamma-lyase